jgi:YD repeat-containing protein
VRKVVGGVATSYVVDDGLSPTGYAQVLVETIQEPGFIAAQPRQYVYGLDLISQRRFVPACGNCSFGSFEVRYHAYDGHGSVRQLTDSTGVVTDTYTYDAFGNLIQHTGTTPNHYLYARTRIWADSVDQRGRATLPLA